MRENKLMNTEEKILEAAKEVFISQGKSGARMQDIANKAGINKSLLHYYYRSKEKLFAAVFEFALKRFIPNITLMLKHNKPFFIKLEEFISVYIDIISGNPFIPLFILSEINKNPEILIKTFLKSGIDLQFIETEIQQEINAGNIRPIQPKHLIINIISLCIFPTVAKNLILPVVFNKNNKESDLFYSERKKIVFEFIINSLRV
jgi:AcrR family transcriptional regulator